MAMTTSRLEIVTPVRHIDMGDVNYLRAPSTDGLFGVMARHTNAVIALEIGEISVEKNGKKELFATGGGFAEIHGDRIVLLVESAERQEEIDVERAQASADRARQRLQTRDAHIDVHRAEAALHKALNRLAVAGK